MLELINVRSGYGKKEVLHGTGVSFEKGKLTSVIGPNGCGKSTLLKTALGILPASSGKVLIDGKDVSLMKRNSIAKKAAYLAQSKEAPDMTVYQTVLHGRFPHTGFPKRYTENDMRIASEAMELMGISELCDSPVASLSGGTRQKVYISMAIAQDTDFILLDEPASYLDIHHQLMLMNILKDLASMGKGIVAVMHDLPLAFTFSDTVAVMRDGKVEAVGTPEDIYASGICEKLFGVGMSIAEDGKSYFCRYNE